MRRQIVALLASPFKLLLWLLGKIWFILTWIVRSVLRALSAAGRKAWQLLSRVGGGLRRALQGAGTRVLAPAFRMLWQLSTTIATGLRRVVARIFGPPLRWLWGLLGRMGIALRHLLYLFVWRPARWLWGLLGRMGIALRHLLYLFVWRPARWLWRLLGRMGIALRRLLSLFVWRPVRFMSAPWRLLYWRFFHDRLVHAVHFVLHSALIRVPLALLRPTTNALLQMRSRWRDGRPRRHRLQARLRSNYRVARARLRILATRPRPPRHAVVAPRAPLPAAPSPRPRQRVRRWATTALAAGLVIIASFITAQQAPQMRGASAELQYQVSSNKLATLTPEVPPSSTPLPTPTPAATPTPWPTPDPLDGGGSVAFTMRLNGNSDIYTLSIGQAQPVRLTHHLADDREPAWSPDGKTLAFASNRSGNWDVYLLSLETGNLRRLTDYSGFDAGPSWSPDGEWIIFESYRQDNLDIYIISADGERGPLRMTRDPAPDFAPVWSPGGRHLAFTSWRNGNKDLFILSLDEAADATALNVTNTPAGFEDEASFSPDGSALAYVDDSAGFGLVYTLQLDNYVPVGQPASRGQGRHPTWSPDGKALSYIHRTAEQSHLIAGSLDAWSVAPQAFTAGTLLDSPHWAAATLPLELPARLQLINETVDEPSYEEAITSRQVRGAPYLLQELQVNAPSPYLSDRVDGSFLALRERTQQAAGWDFLGQLDNLYEPLDASPLPGQSALTWNKAGRAFDYVAEHVLAFSPQVEIVRETNGYETYWRTYLRASAQDGSMGEPLRDLPWDFRARFGAEPQYYDQGGKWRDTIPAGYYVDFTQLAADYGWQRVPANENWRTFFPGIHFWHYEKRQELTWQQAMLELYTEDEYLGAFGQ